MEENNNRVSERINFSYGLAIFIGFFFLYLLSIPLTIFLLCTKYYWLMLIYLLWIFIDRKTCEKGRRRLKSCNRWKVWQDAIDYFPINYYKVDGCDLNPERNYLFCVFPHGVLPIFVLKSFYGDLKDFHRLFPKFTGCPLTLYSNFLMPFFREIVLNFGYYSVRETSIKKLLTYPKGGNIVHLLVGGAEEVIYSRPGSNTIVLNKRKGFIRIALEIGATIVPVYNFGQTDLYDCAFSDKLWFQKLQKYIKSIIGVTPIIPKGEGFLGLRPKQRPISTVVGQPIEISKIENPTKKDIDRFHEIFKNALINLFETEKYKYLKNPEKAKLVIL